MKIGPVINRLQVNLQHVETSVTSHREHFECCIAKLS